jgi:hypothetical protein
VADVKIGLEETLDSGGVMRFVAGFAEATFFHTPAWIETLDASFPEFTVGWLTAREAGSIVGLMPVVRAAKGPFGFLWALPWGTYGHPIARSTAVKGALIDAFARLAAHPLCLEAAVSVFDGAYLSDVPPAATVRMEECSLIPLEGSFEDFWRNALSSKRRQLCNRGLRSGVSVRMLETEEEVRSFHTLYVTGSRSWGGVHPYPLRFFMELFGRRDDGVVFWGGFLEGRLLGGNIDFYFGDMAQAWQAGLSAEAYPYYVGSLLVTAAVEEAYRRGLKVFNLGSSQDDEGIIFFKKSLGGAEFIYPVLEIRKKWWRWLRNR